MAIGSWWVTAVDGNQLPSYAVFDDYRYSQRIAVVVRWILLALWLLSINYRPDVSATLFILDGTAVLVAAVNGYVHWRIWRGRPITRNYVLALSAIDLGLITGGIALTTRFGTSYFVFYYPALLGVSLVLPSRWLSFSVVSVVAIAYAAISIGLEPGVNFDLGEEKVLLVRVATMFAVVAASTLMTRIERGRRIEAVQAERRQAQENLELQKKAQEAERAAELSEANEQLQAELAERKRAERDLERRSDELAAVNKELEAFSYSVSHDLRIPLRSIDGFSQALLEDYTDALDDHGKDYLQRVRRASQRMGELIDDLLELSRVIRGEMRRQAVDLSELAQSVAAELQQRDPDRGVEFVVSQELTAEGDTRLLRVVLENLLGNAWKFTRNLQRARIEFGVTGEGDGAAYFVRDDGVGFDMAYADKLFGAFQRLHTDEEFEGTGIGLATVQRIIGRHGGRIWADGAVGQGATFFFTLS